MNFDVPCARLSGLVTLMVAMTVAACGGDVDTLNGATASSSETGDASQAGCATGTAGASTPVIQVMVTHLTADETGAAGNLDTNLINAWGLSFDPEPDHDIAFWVSATARGLSTAYRSDGRPTPLIANLPFATGAAMGSPSGQVYNPTSDFDGDKLLFATTDGLIAGWASGTAAVARADRSAEGASYSGLALFMNGAEPMLAAANFSAATVDVFDGAFSFVGSGQFVDPDLPPVYAPFNVQALGDEVYVAYAKRGAHAKEVAGPGNGYVSVFDLDGSFDRRLVSRGVLNAPWGMALAPATFEPAPGQLIVGNFGDGSIHAFDPTTGELMGVLSDYLDGAIEIEGLRGLAFGPSKTAEDLGNHLFFTAGPQCATHGLFGKLTTPSREAPAQLVTQR
jgi:uncharacterized protein (TIGR03118 family)